MPPSEFTFYAIENGDQWSLHTDGDVLSVRHQPNASSGGQASTIDLQSFLAHEPHSAQNQALQRLIGTLDTPPPATSAGEVTAIDGQHASE